jgi:hypothetical protein
MTYNTSFIVMFVLCGKLQGGIIKNDSVLYMAVLYINTTFK